MKTTYRLARAVVLAAAVGIAVPGYGQSKPSAKPATRDAKTAPTKPGAPKQEEEEGKIVGISISRANGGFLGLSVENGVFKLAFYDAKKKPTNVDVARAAARWNPSQKAGSDRAVLAPGGDGKSLVGNKFVQPPRIFKVFLTLLNEAGEAVENHTVDFRE